MKFSIITATHNSAKTLQRCINSVVNQTYQDIEYILVDGASTDGTLDIIKSNKDFITKFVSEPDAGIYDALNKGINLATGDVVGFLNSDDEFADEHVIEWIAEVFECQHCDAIYGDLVYQTNSLQPNIVRYWKSNRFRISCLKYGWMPPHPTLYCKKNVYDKLGRFDTSFHVSADYDFILRLFKQSALRKCYFPKVLVKMTVGGTSNGSFCKMMRKSREDYRVIRKNRVGVSVLTLVCKNVRKLMQFSSKRRLCFSFPPL